MVQIKNLLVLVWALYKRQQVHTNTRVITSRMNKATGMAIVITRRLSAGGFTGIPVVVVIVVIASSCNAAHSSELYSMYMYSTIIFMGKLVLTLFPLWSHYKVEHHL